MNATATAADPLLLAIASIHRVDDIDWMAKAGQSGQKSQKGAEPTAVAETEESPFRHYVPGERPRADQAYFELLLWRLASAPGEIPDFDETWPRAVQALSGINLLRLSTLTPAEVREALATVGGEFHSRMSERAESIIRWAESFWRIRQIYGSFRQYLRTFEADGFEALMEDIKIRLPGLTTEFLLGYLRDAGEKVPVPAPATSRERREPEREPQRPPQQQRPPQRVVAEPPKEQRPGPERGGEGRRRRRGRGVQKPPQKQQQPQKAQQPVQPRGELTPAGEAPPKDQQQQQQRRRNRRRFFRRRRSGGDKGGGQPTTPAGGGS